MTRAILDFFDTRHRPLPWRGSTDPYRVWVSEVMLQQTRVETAIPYYERWLDRFPDLPDLAAAEPDDVLRAWAGLGYYARARNLHRAATFVHEQMNGELPRTAEALRALPGVGAYTAGAIASIAFGERVPAIDGNAQRVLSRLFDADLSPAALQDAGRTLVPAERPGDFNQGLMELGATVCLPRKPRCGRCPVRAHCGAAAAGTQLHRPAKKSSRPVPQFRFVAVVAHTADEVLLCRRSERLLHGMWCFPVRPVEDDVASAARAAIRDLFGSRRQPEPCGDVTHQFSHRTEHYAVARLVLPAALSPRTAGDWRWHGRSELPGLAVPAAQRRIARLAGL